MSNFVLFALLGVATSDVSLLGFVMVSRSAAGQFRFAFVLFYVVVTGWLFLWGASSLDKYSLVGLGSAIAVLSVLTEQVIAYWLLPGLVKDLEPFGFEHLVRLAIMLCVAISWYSAVSLAAGFVQSKFLTDP